MLCAGGFFSCFFVVGLDFVFKEASVVEKCFVITELKN